MAAKNQMTRRWTKEGNQAAQDAMQTSKKNTTPDNR